MKRFNPLAAAAAIAVTTLFPWVCRSQAGANQPGSSVPTKPIPADPSGDTYPKKLIPPEGNIDSPFSLESSFSAKQNPVQFVPLSQMTSLDRGLTDAAIGSIKEAATTAGFEFDEGNWSFQQIDCQALPEHILLLFSQNRGAGDSSLFSAAIQRSGNGRVRVIPIQRRGFSTYSPAPVSPLSIAEFNRIRAAESRGKPPDWLSTAMCYAALTGAHPDVTLAGDHSATGRLDLMFPPTIEIRRFGDSTVRFVDVAKADQPMQWALTFDSKGELLKVEHFATPAFAVKPIPAPPDQQLPAQNSP
jgi:hypothetical protein